MKAFSESFPRAGKNYRDSFFELIFLFEILLLLNYLTIWNSHFNICISQKLQWKPYFIQQVLITKLRSANTAETKQYRKASKALLVLIPLLGITYLVVLLAPTEGIGRSIFAIARAVLLSTQVRSSKISIILQFPNHLQHEVYYVDLQFNWKFKFFQFDNLQVLSRSFTVPRKLSSSCMI